MKSSTHPDAESSLGEAMCVSLPPGNLIKKKKNSSQARAWHISWRKIDQESALESCMKLGVGACEPAMVEALTVPLRGTELS